jgi:pyrroline-5-carboxylate reductase
MAEIGFIGAGNMAEAIVGGIVKKGLYAPAQISLYDIRPERIAELSSAFGTGAADSLEALAKGSAIVVLAVKPGTVSSVLGQAKAALVGKLVISIAAGVSLNTILSILGTDARVVRVMPNTPALVLEGASALCASDSCSDADVKGALDIFSAIGRCVRVEEKMMNAVTGLSGSGPAYCFMFLEALADGAVRAGLPRDLAMELAAATLRGAATMVLQTGRHPGALKDMVASPGGTTIEGIGVLESRGFRSAAADAVFAAFQKASKLG